MADGPGCGRVRRKGAGAQEVGGRVRSRRKVMVAAPAALESRLTSRLGREPGRGLQPASARQVGQSTPAGVFYGFHGSGGERTHV
jgi:hypothetical protein